MEDKNTRRILTIVIVGGIFFDFVVLFWSKDYYIVGLIAWPLILAFNLIGYITGYLEAKEKYGRTKKRRTKAR